MKHSNKPRKHVKERFQAVFRSLQADAREYPGGLPALSDQLGRAYGGMKNALCPTNYDSEPTAELIFDVIEACGGHRTVTAIARLGDMTALPMCQMSHGEPADVCNAFLDVARRAGAVSARTVEALADDRLTSAERDEVANLLDDLIGAAVQMRALVRGR
ncbi:phage regulatory CII family protein [Thauera humireducens]|uniref:phage regulatory CII family protein n=1 Tax=Thauera humireducens TaxID=1134435 RepID=UPI00311F7DB2